MDDNFGKAVGGIVIKDEKVLLVRHTYGEFKDKLLIPGGFIKKGEMPEIAVAREIYEETNVVAEAESILCMRFNPENWYIAYLMRYISGEPKSDNKENNETDFYLLKNIENRTDITNFSRNMVLSLLQQHTQLFKLHKYRSPGTTPDNCKIYGMGAK